VTHHAHWRLKFLILLTASFALGTSPAFGEGLLRICRRPGVSSGLDKKFIDVPAGAEFTTAPEYRLIRDTAGKRIIVRTRAPTRIAPLPVRCVVTTADLIENTSGAPVSLTSHRLAAAFVIVGAELEAFIGSDEGWTVR
jgi:hypothetical protein